MSDIAVYGWAVLIFCAVMFATTFIILIEIIRKIKENRDFSDSHFLGSKVAATDDKYELRAKIEYEAAQTRNLIQNIIEPVKKPETLYATKQCDVIDLIGCIDVPWRDDEFVDEDDVKDAMLAQLHSQLKDNMVIMKEKNVLDLTYGYHCKISIVKEKQIEGAE